MIPVLPSAESPYRAVQGRRRASVVSAVNGSVPQVASSASRVPSPPSAMGSSMMVAAGPATARAPRASAAAACAAEALPLNESGATTMTGEGVGLMAPL